MGRQDAAQACPWCSWEGGETGCPAWAGSNILAARHFLAEAIIDRIASTIVSSPFLHLANSL